ncbi:MAG: glycosyltransferase family 87 protein [Candidatus Binatia bacterium]
MSTRFLEVAARAEAMARTRWGVVALALALTLYAAHHVSQSMGDFKVYQRAAERAVAGERIYRLEDPHRYLYAPVVTFLFFPLAFLPTVAGRLLWFAFNAVLLVSVFRSTVRLLFPDGRAPPGFYALVLLLSFRFIDNNLGHGQLNILLLWLVLRAYEGASRARYLFAGLALAGAIAAKIVPVVFLLEIVLHRRWRFLAWSLAAFAALMALPVMWWGTTYPQLLRDWLAVLTDQADHYEMANKINQSIAAFAYRLFRPYPRGSPVVVLPAQVVAAITVALHAAFLFALVLVSRRETRRNAGNDDRIDSDELSLYLLYSTVAAPYSWKYYFANLIFPLGAASTRLWLARRDFEIALWVVFLLNLLAGLELLGKPLATLFQLWSFHFLAAALLFVMLARERWRPAQ